MTLRELLLHHRPTILGSVIRKLRVEHPESREDDLLSNLDGFYGRVVAALGATLAAQEPAEPAKDPSAERHGDQRHRLLLDPASIVHDYGIVCDSIYETARGLGIVVEPLEAQVVNRQVDSACADAIGAYWQRDLLSSRNQVAQTLGQLAHELRNALHTARAALALIQSGSRGRAAEMAERAFERMEELVGSTLADTRAHATATTLRRDRLGLACLLDEIIEMARLPPHVTIAVTADQTLELDADRRLLTSAISNLVDNAVKFTRVGGTIGVRAREEGVNVVIEVEDQCGGLPDDAGDDLFRPFVQKGSDRTGVGLGLAIVREAVAAHGGQVAVRNLPGRGCVFTIALPSVSTRPIPAFRAR